LHILPTSENNKTPVQSLSHTKAIKNLTTKM